MSRIVIVTCISLCIVLPFCSTIVFASLLVREREKNSIMELKLQKEEHRRIEAEIRLYNKEAE
jgi:hypothetical protein